VPSAGPAPPPQIHGLGVFKTEPTASRPKLAQIPDETRIIETFEFEKNAIHASCIFETVSKYRNGHQEEPHDEVSARRSGI